MRGTIIARGCVHCNGDLMYVDGPFIHGNLGPPTALYSCIDCRVHVDVEVHDE